MIKRLKFFFIFVMSVVAVNAQVVFPGGTIRWFSDVPGLTNEYKDVITNVINGGTTGTETGNVERLDARNVRVSFPRSLVDALSNNVQGSFYIDSSGTSVVTYLPGFAFPSLPSVTFTLRDTNADMLVTPTIINLATNNVTVKFISSGGLITNYWRVDYRANYGLSYGVVDDIGTIGMLIDGTNVFRRDGSLAMTGPLNMSNNVITNVGGFHMPSGALASSWLAGNANGSAYWQSRTAANLNDYTSLILANGTRPFTGSQSLGGFNLTGIGSAYANYGYFSRAFLRYATPPAAGYTILAGAGGEMLWTYKRFAEDWYLYLPGATVNFNNQAVWNMYSLSINAGGFLSASRNSFTRNAGTYASPDMDVYGTTRFRRTGAVWPLADVYVDGVLNMKGLGRADYGIFTTQGNPAWYNVAYYAGNSSHLCAEGDIVAGDAAYLAATVPLLTAPWGNIIAQNSVYAGGVKPFRIQHPMVTNKYFCHAATESPLPELIYRGKSTLQNGVVIVNLNDYYAITPGTLDKILTDIQVHVDNNSSWTRVRCMAVSGVSFRIESEIPCNDEVQWIAIGRRCDSGVKEYKIEVDK